MTRLHRTLGAAALLIAPSGPALAQITASELWSDWQALYAEMGYDLTAGSESMEGDTLVLRDLQIDFAMPDMDMRSSLARIEMTNRDDGTVAVSFAPEYELVVESRAEPKTPVTVDMTVDLGNLQMIAAREGGLTSYDYSAERIGLTVDEATSEGEPFPFDLTLTMDGFDGSYELTEADPVRFTTETAIDALSYDLSVEDPDGENGSVTASGSYDGVHATASSDMASIADMADPELTLDEDVSLSVSYAHEGGKLDTTTTEPDGSTFELESSSESGMFEFAIEDGGIAYQTGATGLSLTASGSAVPLPELRAEIAEARFGIELPVAESEEARPFGLELALEGVEVSDQLWSMIDPQEVLPREPAALVLELSGQARLTANLSSPETMEADTPPGELKSLDIETLRVAIAGAELTGTGGFTFDNEGPGALGPMPMPTGSVDLGLTGGMTLIDRLTQMGLVRQEQAGMARMMLGMLAVPGEGEDALSSRIEIGPEGKITANGAPLPF